MIRSTSSLFLWLCLIIGASLMLYHTSDKVHALNTRLADLNRQIEAEQKSLHVLKAEWVYLANPARIESKAKRHLKLKPTGADRISSLQNMGGLLPLNDGVVLAATKAPEPLPATASPIKVVSASAAPRTKHDRILASLNAGRINERMTLQHAVEAKPDRLDAVIGKLGLRP